MIATEVCLINLSASSSARLVSHLPAGTPVRLFELEDFLAAGLGADAIADRLRHRLAVPRERVLVGWGVGGVVADALAAPARRVVVLDGPAPGGLPAEPGEAALLRSFAMYLGARRGIRLAPAPTLERLRAAAIAAGAVRPDTTASAFRRCFAEHAEHRRRDHRVIADALPSGRPVTVVKAADSIAPDSPALGWERFAPVELLAGGGDHYSMLTQPAAATALALLLRRWLTPALAA